MRSSWAASRDDSDDSQRFSSADHQAVVVIVEKENSRRASPGLMPKSFTAADPEVSVKATDANEDQHLTYSLGAGAPAEAGIDPATGQFTWTPPDAVTEQSLEVEILATDDGRPPKTASLKVPITVKTDVALFTRFVGSVADTAASEAWLFDRWNKRDLYVKVGETLQVADISAQLTKIESDVLYLSAGQGNLAFGAGARPAGHETRLVETAKTARTE